MMASSTKDEYNYAQRNILPGTFHAFGLGICLPKASPEPSDSCRKLIEGHKLKFRRGKKMEGGGGHWWWACLGPDLVKLLEHFGFTSPPVLGLCSLEEALSTHLHKLTNFGVEGVVLTEQSQSKAAGAVLKWKNRSHH